MIQEIARFLEPWKTLYSNSTAISATVTSAHIVALVIGGGLAIAADRTTLRALKGTADQRQLLLRELHAVHRPVLLGIALLFITGVLLMAADFKAFAESPVFWVKIILLASLLVNGALLYAAESHMNQAAAANVEASPKVYSQLRSSSLLSIGLWLAVTVAGAVLPSAV